MSEKLYIVPAEKHNALVNSAYQHRGYTADEAAGFSELASHHGIRTYNAIKALHLDHLFGSAADGCTPGANIEKSIPASLPAVVCLLRDAMRRVTLKQ